MMRIASLVTTIVFLSVGTAVADDAPEFVQFDSAQQEVILKFCYDGFKSIEAHAEGYQGKRRDFIDKELKDHKTRVEAAAYHWLGEKGTDRETVDVLHATTFLCEAGDLDFPNLLSREQQLQLAKSTRWLCEFFRKRYKSILDEPRDDHETWEFYKGKMDSLAQRLAPIALKLKAGNSLSGAEQQELIQLFFEPMGDSNWMLPSEIVDSAYPRTSFALDTWVRKQEEAQARYEEAEREWSRERKRKLRKAQKKQK